MVEGQRPGESDRDFARRLQREAKRQEQERRDKIRQDELDAEAEQEKQLKRQDDKWEREMLDALGTTPEGLRAELRKVDPDLARKAEEIGKARKQGKKRKAARLARKNKGKFTQARKRKGKGKDK